MAARDLTRSTGAHTAAWTGIRAGPAPAPPRRPLPDIWRERDCSCHHFQEAPFTRCSAGGLAPCPGAAHRNHSVPPICCLGPGGKGPGMSPVQRVSKQATRAAPGERVLNTFPETPCHYQRGVHLLPIRVVAVAVPVTLTTTVPCSPSPASASCSRRRAGGPAQGSRRRCDQWATSDDPSEKVTVRWCGLGLLKTKGSHSPLSRRREQSPAPAPSLSCSARAGVNSSLAHFCYFSTPP